MNVSVRPGPKSLHQADFCAEIHAAAFAGAGIRAWSAGEFSELLDRPFSLLISAPGGILLAGIIDEDAEILTFAVHPSKQKQGLGAALLKVLMDHCRCRKVTKCILEVANNNYAAVKMYERFSFKQIGVRKNYFQTGRGFVSALVMEKSFLNDSDLA